MTTCTDHEVRGLDASSPCWRGSYDLALVEMIAVRDECGCPIVTTWDYGHFHDGGRYGCDGSDTGQLLIPLPGELFPWLN